ncbi:Sad1 / UNC-like protein [Ancylostoma ceylanicum]|uniref:Sad1 / UNC-like protein n=1 Tax=Ancylostoma ceylanicum TaxID=53326 RepID=A0A0D6M5Z3_9BILA|nr:Sad1 / UNC-like protein [Ancylostoma ceylanicum]
MSRASESPLEKMFRRRPSFKRPPIRDVHSPRLTDDEADQLTSPFLQSYNPDKPPAWEVPNINNNFLHISNQEYTQHAAPSIMCRIFVSTRCVGESITDCVYEQIGNYRRSFRRRSFLEIVTMTFLKLVYALASVLRYPVELICRVFRAVNLTLTRRYYEVLAANGRRLNNQAMIKKLRAANKATDLYNHWMLLRKAEQESAQRYEWSGDKYDPNDPNDPDTRFYNLRSRNIASFDTDSEDDEIPKRRKTVRFDTVPSEVVPDNSEFRKMSMAYRIATWLGSTASSVVYYLLYVAHLVVLCVKTPYNFVVGKDDSNYTTPSNSKEEVVLVGRHPRRRMIAGSDDSYDEFNQNLFVGPEPSPDEERIFMALGKFEFPCWYFVQQKLRFEMPSLNMPSVERTNWSTLYTASTTQMAKYLPSAPNVSSWKSSAVDIATNAEKSFYNFVWSLKAVGASAIAVSQQILLTLFRLIAYPFHLLCDSVPEVLSWKSSALSAGSTAEQYFYSGLTGLANIGELGKSSEVKVDGSTRQTFGDREEAKERQNIVYVPSPTSPIDEKKLIEKITAIVHAKMDQDLKLKLETELRALKSSYEEKILSLKAEKSRVDIDYSHLESLIRAAIYEYDSDKTGMFDFALESAGAHQAPAGQRPSCPKTFKIWAYKSEADMDTRVLLGDFTYDIKGPPLQFFVIKTQPDYPVKIIEMEVTSNYGAEYTSLYRLRVHGSLYKPGNE